MVKISETIDKLKSEKRIFANKLLEFTKAFKNTIAKMEKKYDEKFAEYEKKLDEIKEERIHDKMAIAKEAEIQTKVVEKHSDDVAKLEQEYDKTKMLLHVIDKSIVELDNKIIESNHIIDELKKEKAKDETKQCIFDRTGFCREDDQCEFLHSEVICEIFLEKGLCPKQRCIKRHPKACRYFQRGFCKRGDECRYLHKTKIPDDQIRSVDSCDRCRNISHQRYYCEFCRKDFCPNCTAEDAHDKNVYIQNQETPSCSDIHL